MYTSEDLLRATKEILELHPNADLLAYVGIEEGAVEEIEEFSQEPLDDSLLAGIVVGLLTAKNKVYTQHGDDD